MDDGGGGGGGSKGGQGGGVGSGHGGGSAAVAGDASTGPAGVVDELDELWPSRRPSPAVLRLAEMWVANPATSHQWTLSGGGVE